ncbi:MAG: LOG family protein [Opitutales bacterium]|nr:LOG family protein [Opitutales bacterium]
MARKKATSPAPKFDNPDSSRVKLAEQPIDCAFDNMAIRLVNIQRDLIMPAIAFEHFGVENTITFFGASRIKSPEVAKANLAALQKSLKGKKPSAKHRESLRMAHADVAMSKYYTAARELAMQLQLWINKKHLPREKTPVLMSGGGPGIMEAANRGASEAGGKTVGLTIYIPDERRANEYISEGMHIPFHYFIMRKFWLIFFSKAIVVFPGGMGTLDEFCEVVTLMKTAKIRDSFPLVLFGREFWKKTLNLENLVAANVMARDDLKLIDYADTVEEACKIILPKLEAKLCGSPKKSK